MVVDYSKILTELSKFDGKAWRIALGELHSQYNELCFWVLLDSHEQLKFAVEEFRKTILYNKKEIGDIGVTISFYMIKEKVKKIIVYLENEDIFDDRKLDVAASEFEAEPIKENDMFLVELKRREQRLQ